MRNRPLALAALSSLAALLAVGCGTTSPAPGAAYDTTSAVAAATPASPSATASGAPMTAARTILTVRQTKLGYVLVTAAGMTVYWYADDVKGSGKSACTGGCASAWPAVVGTPAAAAGVTLSGKLGTITRASGVIQATYNGYPLYTYAADMSAGQTLGNGIGGVWHVIAGAARSRLLRRLPGRRADRLRPPGAGSGPGGRRRASRRRPKGRVAASCLLSIPRSCPRCCWPRWTKRSGPRRCRQ